MTTCPTCHAPVPDRSRFCGSCGSAVTATPTPPRSSRSGHAPDDPTMDPSPTEASTVTHHLQPRSPSSHSHTPGATVHDDSLYTPGSIISGRYRIVACLGKGGMGEVYRADDLTLGQPVALKFLPAALAASPRWMERFRNEVRTSRQVAHPNVCRVHDLGDIPSPDGNGTHQFLTMEYIDGEDLASLLRRIGRLPRDKAVQLAHQMCAGLAAAHNAGVLHRDLKPANIMIDGRGNAKITDFGIAGLAGQIEGADVRSGTPAYMSPEQLAGREVSLRSDIYSLGLVLYELFTGRRAFKADTATSATASRTAAEVSRPSTIVDDMDPAVERVIMRCLSEDPALRPSSAMIVAAGLPGGDPLRAALEAGETPSPELVAAAGSDRRVPRRLAISLLVFSLACIAGCIAVSRWTGLTSFVPMPRSPEVLADRARDVLSRLAPDLTIKDDASNLSLDLSELVSIARRSAGEERWSSIRSGRSTVLEFWYRTSPRELSALNVSRTVAPYDPALDVPGMTLIELDSDGRLSSFQAVPPWPKPPKAADPKAAGLSTDFPAFPADTAAKASTEVPKTSSFPQPAAYNWSAAFELAGLDPARLTPTEPDRVPAHFADERFAWEYAPGPDSSVSLRIEAATYEQRPTAFRVLAGPSVADISNFAPASVGRIFSYFLQSLIIVGMGFAAWLARKHMLTGRGDRSGAARLAWGFFVLGIAVWALTTHFTTDLMVQWSGFLRGTSRALLLTALAWVSYMALEPFIRRRAPQLIVSWTRLISGRVRDPFVGRDALIGITAGAAFALATRSLPLLHETFSGRMPMPSLFDVRVLGGVLGALAFIADAVVTASINAMLIFFLFFALCALLPKYRTGMVLFGLLVAGAFLQDPPGSHIAVSITYSVLIGTILTVGLWRVGLFSFVVAIFVASVLLSAPLSTDFAGWHTRGAAVVLAAIAALIFWAFTSATGLGAARPLARQPAPT